MDYTEARQRMVDGQIAARGVTCPRVIAAMRRIERHRFVPPANAGEAYEDHPVHIGCGQTISQPYMVARMTEMLALRPEDRVLEIGTGSGYQTAMLAELVREVISIERQPELAERARALLKQLGYTNVCVHCGDGTLGWAQAAPYDAILVTAGSPAVPPALLRQLAEGGRLVCPTGSRELQRLASIVHEGGEFHEQDGISCVFVPLVGKQGWAEGPPRS